MKIYPIINKMNELYNQKQCLIIEKKHLINSIKQINKNNIKSKFLKEINAKSDIERSHLELSIDSIEEQLNNVKEKIRMLQKEMKTTCMFYVSWSFVSFHNGYIEIVFEDLVLKTIEFPESKESFKYVKINLIKKLRPFKVIWSRLRQELILMDTITFKNAILYLSIKDKLSQKSDDNLIKIKRLVSDIKNEKSFFSLFFDKSLYLEYLANKQSLSYLIIPTEENIRIGYSYVVEDSFIFTITTLNTIYILWENVNKERATFIFKTSTEEYDNDLQIIFDYIVGISSGKRRMLYIKQSDYSILNSCSVLYHSDYRSWENKMEALLA